MTARWLPRNTAPGPSMCRRAPCRSVRRNRLNRRNWAPSRRSSYSSRCRFVDAVAVGVAVSVAVSVAVGAAVSVPVGVAVSVPVGIAVSVPVGVAVSVAVDVAVSVAAARAGSWGPPWWPWLPRPPWPKP
jgi:hypothetical protein